MNEFTRAENDAADWLRLQAALMVRDYARPGDRLAAISALLTVALRRESAARGNPIIITMRGDEE